MRPEELGGDDEELDVFQPQRPLPLRPVAAERLFLEARPAPAGPPDPPVDVVPDAVTDSAPEEPGPAATPPIRTQPLGLLVGSAVLAACGLLVVAVVREAPASLSGESTATATAVGPGAGLPALPRIPADTRSPSVTPSAGGRETARQARLEPAASRISATAHRPGGSGGSGGEGSRTPTTTPAPDVTQWSVQSVNYPDHYWSHRDGLGRLDPVSGSSSARTRKEATFTVVPGLADAGCYSFKVSAGHYLQNHDFRIRTAASDGTAQFRQDATFCARHGWYADSWSFESYSYPGRYLRHRDFQLWVDPYQGTSLYRADSSFRIASPWN